MLAVIEKKILLKDGGDRDTNATITIEKVEEVLPFTLTEGY